MRGKVHEAMAAHRLAKSILCRVFSLEHPNPMGGMKRRKLLSNRFDLAGSSWKRRKLHLSVTAPANQQKSAPRSRVGRVRQFACVGAEIDISH